MEEGVRLLGGWVEEIMNTWANNNNSHCIEGQGRGAQDWTLCIQFDAAITVKN